MATGHQPDPLQNPSQGPAGQRRPDGGAGIAEAAKAQAQAAWSETKDSVRSSVAHQQEAAAEGIGDMAGALRTAAQQLGGQRKETVASLAEYAADGLERLSGTLRSKDLDTLVHDVEDFARRQPALFFGAAVAAGFLALRFLKSSREHPDSDIAPSAGRSFGPDLPQESERLH
jgi:hypothetical protein